MNAAMLASIAHTAKAAQKQRNGSFAVKRSCTPVLRLHISQLEAEVSDAPKSTASSPFVSELQEALAQSEAREAMLRSELEEMQSQLLTAKAAEKATTSTQTQTQAFGQQRLLLATSSLPPSLPPSLSPSLTPLPWCQSVTRRASLASSQPQMQLVGFRRLSLPAQISQQSQPCTFPVQGSFRSSLSSETLLKRDSTLSSPVSLTSLTSVASETTAVATPAMDPSRPQLAYWTMPAAMSPLSPLPLQPFFRAAA